MSGSEKLGAVEEECRLNEESGAREKSVQESRDAPVEGAREKSEVSEQGAWEERRAGAR